MRAGGWIPREQILGVEARARFPAHVRHLKVQSPAVANPPTLLMLLRSTAVNALAEAAAAAARAATGVPADRCPPPVPGGVTAAPVCVAPPAAAVTAYAAARELVVYLTTTQAGPIPGAYRWRGWSAEQAAADGTPHTLASGLDDFPRGRTTDDRERHVDLAAWVASSHGHPAAMAAASGAGPAAVARHAADRAAAVAAVFGHHAVTTLVGATSGSVRVVGPARTAAGSDEAAAAAAAAATSTSASALTPSGAAEEPEAWHPSTMLCDWDGAAGAPVCHDGYVRLLPLLLGVVPPDAPAAAAGLAAMADPLRLAGRGGLRSLSPAATAAGTADGYWTGPVWVLFSYLATVAERRAYARVAVAPVGGAPRGGRGGDLAAATRRRLLANTVSEWVRSSAVWEVYDGAAGAGRRGAQFCGWSVLAMLAAAKRYEGVL